MNTEINNSTIIIELLKKLDQRLEIVENFIETSKLNQNSSETQSLSSLSNEFVQEFQLLIDNHISPLLECAKKTEQPEFLKQVNHLVNAVNQEMKFIELASKHTKPNKDTLLEIVKPINSLANNICQIRDKVERKSIEFNSLSAISESIGFLSWVILDKTPRFYVEEMRHSAEFYTNRVMVENRGKNKDQIEWVNHYINFLLSLESYIKKYHITGLCWNFRGTPLNLSALSTTEPIENQSQSKNSSNSKPSHILLNEINNKGENITSSLKKVRKEMKSNDLNLSKSKPESTPSVKVSTIKAKEPKISNDYDKWLIENQVDNKDIVISVLEKRQSVYIYKCSNSVIQIKGKVNQIIMNDCKKTSIVFEDAISSCQVVNCTSSEIQVIGLVPSISIDNTSGCQIYLSKSSLTTQIIASKSSEMNVLIPNPNQDEQDMIEIPIPEQFISTIKNNKLYTEFATHI